MEIKIEDLFTIKDKQINGIVTSNKEEMAHKIYLKRNKKEKVWINGKELLTIDRNEYKEKIRIIPKEMDSLYFRYKVYEAMYIEIQRNQLSLVNPKKKVLDSLKIVGLDITYLNRNIHDLSSSERKLLQIGMTLMTNPELIIMIEPFKDLDIKKERKLTSFLQIIKEQYDKTIVIISDDTNMLYKYADHIIIEKNDKILTEGNCTEVFEQVEFLKKHDITIPDIVEFTYLAKKKKIKIDYHKDIRDLIKDIYKHV